jgi:WD40 repeat protein
MYSLENCPVRRSNHELSWPSPGPKRGRVSLIELGPACRRALLAALALLACPAASPGQGRAALLSFETRTQVRALAFSPDGKTLAALVKPSGQSPSQVRLWDVKTRKEFGRLTLRGYAGNVLAFTPDGKGLVASTYRGRDYIVTVEVWGLKEHKIRLSFDLPSGVGNPDGRGAAVTPDGKVLAVGGCKAGLFALDTGKELGLLEGRDEARSVALSRDGRRLATVGLKGQLSIWDVKTRKLLRTIDAFPADRGPYGPIGLAFSPDSTEVAAATGSGDRRAGVWGVARGERRAWLDLQKCRLMPQHITYRPGGVELVLAGSVPNGGWLLWEPRAGKVSGAPVKSELYEPTAMALSPDGRTLAVGYNEVYLWRLAPSKKKGKWE